MLTTVVLATSMLSLVACSEPAEPPLKAKVAPPAILTQGRLTVGVDLDVPPFAGTDADRRAGLDVDVAAALAERLGLAVTYVDVSPSEAATALAERRVDVVMSVSLTDSSLSALSLAGSYATDGPGFFVATDSTSSIEPSVTIESVGGTKVAVQRSSAAHWLLLNEYGEEGLQTFDTLRAAIEALDRGEVSLVAGDAFVAGYIARDHPRVRFAGQLGSATPLSVALAPESTDLADAVRDSLDALAADGVFDTLRRKWVGELPALEVLGTEDEGAE
jgi:polar amino acid transport system substrate-binding protein